MLLFFFFFKQKTAYEMRISDWSSDVCSSDLLQGSPDVVSYMPSGDEDPSEDLLERVELLYTDDAMLHALWAEAIDIQRLAGDAASGGRQLAQLATIAGRLLSSRHGPSIAVLELPGGGTHTNRTAEKTSTLKSPL